MAARDLAPAAAGRLLGILVCLLCVLPIPAAAGHLSTLAYRETSESFTWEIDWDGAAPAGSTEVVPVRPDPSLPELWTPSLRLVSGPKGFSCTFSARHNCRVHEMDAPKGALLKLTFGRREALQGPPEWGRIDTRSLVHLHTGKDHKDDFDLLARTELDPQGRKLYRLVLQGTHGLQAKAKKLKGGKAGKPGKMERRGRHEEE